MRCGDLERYLEAFLDGRLGRSRGAVLRRHLASCGACQARVERLRQFERDTHRRFRALEQPGSVWEGLEFDLVGSAGGAGAGRLLAPPRPAAATPGPAPGPARPEARRPAGGHPLVAARGRGTTPRLAGVLLVAMALGAVYQFARESLPRSEEEEATRAYLDLQGAGTAPALLSGEASRVEDWLAAELGTPVPLPPVPDGFRLIGASRAPFAAGEAGAVIYAGDDAATVMLFARPWPEASAPPPAAAAPSGAAAEAGLREVAWEAGAVRYTVVGPLPEDELRLFAAQ